MWRKRRRSKNEMGATSAGPPLLDLSAVVLSTAEEEPRSKLSILRVLLSVAVIGGAG